MQQIRRIFPRYHTVTAFCRRYCKTKTANDTVLKEDEKPSISDFEYFKQLTASLHPDQKSKHLVKNQSRNIDIPKSKTSSVTEILMAEVRAEADSSKVDSESKNLKQEIQSTNNRNQENTQTNALQTKNNVTELNEVDRNENELQVLDQNFKDSSNIIKPKHEETAISTRKTKIALGTKLVYNLAAFVNESNTLQQFVKMGVHMSYWDSLEGIPQFILQRDFERDLKPHITFLVDNGVPADSLAKYLTKNPFIFQQDLDILQSRIDYFKSKNFNSEAIGRVITKAPFILNFKVSKVDGRLGYFQTQFKLTGNEVRKVITRQPKLVTFDLSKIKRIQFSMTEEFGFSPSEIKTILMNKPKLWLASQVALQRRFNLIHNTMGITQEQISQFPEALLSRQFRIKQRHLFLEKLNRAQYDPTKENYISLKAFVSGNDQEFCRNCAKTSVEEFNDFLKTL